GLPVIGGATIGTPGRAGVGNATAVPVFTEACLPEFSERNVAQPSTSAIAAPAARPRLSRRLFCRATIGKAFVLATTSACSLSSNRGSVCGTCAGSDERTGSSQGPRMVRPGASITTRLAGIVGIRQLVAVKRSYVGNLHPAGRANRRRWQGGLRRGSSNRCLLRRRGHQRNTLTRLFGRGGRNAPDCVRRPQQRVFAAVAEHEVRRDRRDHDILAAHPIIDRAFFP